SSDVCSSDLVSHHHQLGFGHAVRAVEINAGEIQGGLFNVSPFKRVDMERKGFVAMQDAFLIHSYGDGSDLQQGVSARVETARLNVDDDRKKAPKTLSNQRFGISGVIRWVHGQP